MLYYSNAKINLGLNVVEKREDGFHNIETIFYPISINDALEFIPAEKVGLSSSGIEIDCNLEDNLIIKAYKLLQSDFSLPNLQFHIHKIIPFGAGLGGGSANAAATLQALNTFFELNISKDKLQEYASKIGSDCAFFIKNKPVFAKDKGDVFTDIHIDLLDYYILLIHPGFGVSTVDAYANILPQKPKISVKEIINQPLESWANSLKNDFENPVFQKHSILKTIKSKLYSKGAIYAAMSGSGSSMFGLFKEKPSDKEFKEYWTWIGKL